MAAKTGGERRRHARAALSLSVEWGETPDCARRGRVTSLSAGGCFLRTRAGVPERSVVFIRLMLAPGAASSLEGMAMARVLYNLKGDGFGAEFMRLKAGHERDIQDLVDFYRGGG